MKVKQSRGFQPIVITLENEDEVRMLFNLLSGTRAQYLKAEQDDVFRQRRIKAELYEELGKLYWP